MGSTVYLICYAVTCLELILPDTSTHVIIISKMAALKLSSCLGESKVKLKPCTDVGLKLLKADSDIVFPP